MAAPKNNPIISNIRTFTKGTSRRDPRVKSFQRRNPGPSLRAAPSSQERRISASPNISYISKETESNSYPSTDELYRRDAYKENQMQPTLGNTQGGPERKASESRVSDSSYASEVNRQRSKAGQRIRQAFTKAKSSLKEFGIFENEELESLLATPPEKETPFPTVIFIFAIIKDLIDTAEITLVGIILTKILSIIFAIILFFWILGKASGGWWKKKIIKWLWKRYIAVIIIELIPIVGLIPTNTIFILMAHNRETKFVKAINLALEELKNAGSLKHMIERD